MGNILSAVRDVFIVCGMLYILYKIRTTPPTYTPHSDSSAAPRADVDHVLGNSHSAPPTDGEHIAEEDAPSSPLTTPPVHEEPSGQMDQMDPPAPRGTTGIDAPVTPLTDDGDDIPEGSRSSPEALDVPSQDRGGTTTRRLSVQLFSNSSDFSIAGVTFNNVAGNMIINNPDHADLQRMFSEATEAMFRQYLRDLPPSVGHSSKNAMVITDALGGTATFSWDIVSTYEVRAISVK
ncbi:hypothetical protein EST38_g11026 [Candolleomyces aberdarensis]|uniref:Uncharacterized protein n=1 Tax=Candolleomyces aberdarensis TaxID=2316362 RepID=A0A4V1Q2E7_9AGAR|nr:hypothetical protein EST38_g11026 [Candolleomyces aberdarensis]